ncbi:AAA family ATPase [Ruminobacter amylophilus]|uniref:AAA family ATPase n=1 Tax=Ruminobacter amylophilus TaxID=867 RepID=UPI0038660475
MIDAIKFLKLIPVWSDIDLAVANYVSNLCANDKKVHGFVLGMLLQHARNNGSVCIKYEEIGQVFEDIIDNEISLYKRSKVIAEFNGRLGLSGKDTGAVNAEDSDWFSRYLAVSGLDKILNELSQKSFYDNGGPGESCMQFIDDSVIEYVADSGRNLHDSMTVGRQIREVRVPLVYSLERIYISRYFAYELIIAGYIRNSVRIECITTGKKSEKLSPGFDMKNIHNMWTEVYDAIDEVERKLGGSADKNEINWQKVAVAMSLCHPFSIITGGPGTGKTYTVSVLICLLKKICSSLRIGIAAPTGKAAARVKESLNDAFSGPFAEAYRKLYPNLIDEIAPAETVHKMLGIFPGKSVSRVNENNPLNLDVLIIDEVSMMDIFLMNKVVAALRSGTRLILLGDKDQLASVEAGSVLGDICTILGMSDKEQKLTDYEKDVVTGLTGYTEKELFSVPGLASGIASLHKSRRYESSPLIGVLANYVNSQDFRYSETMNIVRKQNSAELQPLSGGNSLSFGAVTSDRDDRNIKGVVLINGCGKELVDILCEKAVTGWNIEKSGTDEKNIFDLPSACASYRKFVEYTTAHPVLSSTENENGECAQADSYVAKAFGMINAFRVLCPERQGFFGVRYVNDGIATAGLRWLKKHADRDKYPEIATLDKTWYPGLILMVTKNDSNLGLKNGDMVICGYDEKYGSAKRVWVQMENKKYKSVSFGMLAEYETGFAMTIHKSQGSEFDHTMMVMNGTERTITKELVYTGITRARYFVSMIVGNNGCSNTVNLDDRFAQKVKRSSGLSERLYGR